MDIQAKARLFKGAAIIIVFVISAMFPILICNELRKSGMTLLIRQDLETVNNWATLYKIEKSNYKGLENYFEIVKKEADIKDKGGKMQIFVSANGDTFCVRSTLTTKGSWCVDSKGYSGKVINGCRVAGNFLCK
jgi:hypothetical protein